MRALPALRGKQGDRTLYLVLPTNRTIGEIFTSEIEPHDERAQRAMHPKHAQNIADYVLENRSEYVLGAITYAVDVEGTFTPAFSGAPFGTLELPNDARLRSVDGQHRRHGLSEAMTKLEDVADDNTALLLYVEDDLQRRRQMFSDMNWTPRRVSASQNVAFDSRDPFSRATQRLVRSHPLLKGRVEQEQARVPRGSSLLFTLGGVYDATKRLWLGPNGRLKNYNGLDEEAIVDRAKRFFDLLQTRLEFKAADEGESVQLVQDTTILMSSTTLRVLAGAVHQCIDHHRRQGMPFHLEDLTGPLSKVDFSPEAHLWISSGFVSPGRSTPNARNQEVLRATNLLAGELLGLRAE
jgi:DGQHR domain-containing protein